MYVIHWSAFCCDTGHHGGTAYADSFHDALASWHIYNDPAGSDGPCGAVIYRNGKEIVPAKKEAAAEVRIREILAGWVSGGIMSDDWPYVETLIKYGREELARLEEQKRAALTRFWEVAERACYRRGARWTAEEEERRAKYEAERLAS